MAKDGKLLRLRLSRLLKDGDGLFCLPLGFRDVLLDISERLTWAKTWETDNGEQASLSDADWQKIELGIWRLTDMCEIIINNIIEVPPTPVTVNNSNSCGRCGGGSTINFPELVGQDGNPITVVCLPVDPTNPTGETPPATWNDELEEPPPGWDDFQDFQDARCIIANYALDAFVDVVNNIDDIENAISTILDVASLVLMVLPTPLGKLKGAATVAKWIARLRIATEAAQEFTEGAEEVIDYAQVVSDYVRDNKPQLICIIYEATSVFDAVTQIMDLLASLLPSAAEGWYKTYYDAIIGYMELLFSDILNTMYTYRANQLIESGYVPQINCSSCENGVANVAKITGVAAGEVNRSTSWLNGEPLKVVGGVVVSQLTGLPVGEYWQTADVINHITFANNFSDMYAVRLSTKTAAPNNRWRGYLTLATDINSIYAGGYKESSSFGKIYAKVTANGETLLQDVQLQNPVGYSPTAMAANLPYTLPAGTICYVEFSSTAGHDELILDAYLSDTVFPFNTSGAG